jgi:hypothetical protein
LEGFECEHDFGLEVAEGLDVVEMLLRSDGKELVYANKGWIVLRIVF